MKSAEVIRMHYYYRKLNRICCDVAMLIHFCRLFSFDGLTRLGSLYNRSHRPYSKMSFSSGNITIEQFRNFRESKMEFWNIIVPNMNATCDAMSSKSSTIGLTHMFYYICTLHCYFVIKMFVINESE
jgi:hypothetical protein